MEAEQKKQRITTGKREKTSRASNDPRQRRREQRAARAQQAQAPKIAPSQVPTLGQYTVSSLIKPCIR